MGGGRVGQGRQETLWAEGGYLEKVELVEESGKQGSEASNQDRSFLQHRLLAVCHSLAQQVHLLHRGCQKS